MKRTAALLAVSLLLSCTGLGTLRPVDGARRADIASQCRALFPGGQWQATHILEADLPLGQEGSFMAAVATEEEGRGFRSVLMSLEGFVLFDATYQDGRIATHRAVPPLDEPGFARGMTGDIRLLLFPPDGVPSEVGETEAGHGACRWQRATGKTVEVEMLGQGCSRIRLYDDDGRVERDATLSGTPRGGFAPLMQLVAPGGAGYTLRLKLLDTGRGPAER